MDRFNSFTLAISNISRYIYKIEAEEMKKFNLKPQHISCLYYLNTNGSLTSKELVDISLEDKASISRSIKYLEKNGYIICESNAKKRYNDSFTLTEKGKEISNKISIIISDVLELGSNGLNDDERNNLYKYLYIITKNLEKILKSYKN